MGHSVGLYFSYRITPHVTIKSCKEWEHCNLRWFTTRLQIIRILQVGGLLGFEECGGGYLLVDSEFQQTCFHIIHGIHQNAVILSNIRSVTS